ncbi:WD40 repeat domain-containing protein [Fodinicola feengrottensis]|uniref:WD40 repeat domain-containing protein n=1 Tax=Fodinicola feengrottensis TaxID=435914 RepID=UPI0013CFFFB2|nr:WD40 repeat domain-containing protein [Fodinicola feengrottensis]
MVVLVLGAVIMPRLLPSPPRPAVAPAGTPALPNPIAGLSLLAGSVAASPPGAAIAYYTAVPEADLGYEQPMILSAYGDRYRRLTQADDRGCRGVDDGLPLLAGPAKALLSPDGRRVAIGDSCAAHGDIEMVDLSTGQSRSFPLLKGRAVRAMAWSASGRYLAYLITPNEHEPLTGTYPNIVQTGKGILGLLDVTTGSTRQFPAYTQVRAVAFRPDGREIAVQDGATLRILAADGSQLRTLPIARDHELSDANAWSPDGSMLVTGPLSEPPTGLNPTQTFLVVDPSGLGRTVPKAVSQASNPYSPILGWRSADSFPGTRSVRA